jgi:hypothetical protein
MAASHQLLSATRINRLKAQGYCNYSDTELSELAFGNRFAYIVCGSLVAFGVATANIPILVAMTIVAFFGIILPYHPLDYIYNHVLRSMLNKPELPPRSKKLKFTCIVATLWMIAVIYSFYAGFAIAGYVFGGMLVAVAFIVRTTDFCIPSMIYNIIFKVKV